MTLHIDTDMTAERFVVGVAGDLDVGTIPKLHDALQRAGLSNSTSIALDLDGLVSLDDVALGILGGELRSLADRGRQVWIICNNSAVIDRLKGHRLLDTARLVGSAHDITSG
jgi:anti-anti-sigma factor